MSPEEFKRKLDNHKKYLKTGDMSLRADMSGADLSGVDLRWIDLRNINLSGANLRGANVSGADLRGAVLKDVLWTNAVIGNTRFSEPVYIVSLSRHQCVFTQLSVSIGCYTMSWVDWASSILSMGEHEGYSESEIEEYVEMFMYMHNRIHKQSIKVYGYKEIN